MHICGQARASIAHVPSQLVFARRALPVLAVMGMAGSAWAAVLIGGLLAGVRFVPLAVAVLVTVALVIPGFVIVVVMIGIRSSTRRMRPADFWDLFGRIPRWPLIVAGCLFFAFWFAGITSFAGISGSAGVQEGQYVIDNHGTVTVVSKATYDREVAHEERLVVGVLGGFGGGGAVLCAATAAYVRLPI